MGKLVMGVASGKRDGVGRRDRVYPPEARVTTTPQSNLSDTKVSKFADSFNE